MRQRTTARSLLMILFVSGIWLMGPAMPAHAARSVKVRFQDPANCKVDQGCYNRSDLQAIITMLTTAPDYNPDDPPTVEVSGQFGQYRIRSDSRIVIMRSIRLMGVNEGGKPVVIDGNGQYRPIRIVAPTNGEPFKVTVSGFTIKNGLASLNEPVENRYFGGAIYLENAPSSVVISNNLFLGNAAGDTKDVDTFGGALGISGGAPQIRANIFQTNRAVLNSSGKCCPRRGHGGAIALYNSAAVISNNMFSGNVAGVGQGIAGGVYLSGGDSALITGNTFLGNSASDTNASSPNVAGALYAYAATNLTVSNNVIAYNGDAEGAGGVLIDATAATIVHNTFASNMVNGLQVRSASSVVATNNIITENNGTGVVVNGSGAVLTLQWTLFNQGSRTSAINGGTLIEQATMGNMDPLFATGTFNYHITAASRARDLGAATLITTDIDGDRRPIGLDPDIGADEFAYRAHLPLGISPTP